MRFYVLLSYSIWNQLQDRLAVLIFACRNQSSGYIWCQVPSFDLSLEPHNLGVLIFRQTSEIPICRLVHVYVEPLHMRILVSIPHSDLSFGSSWSAGELIETDLCHCTDCQKWSGGGYTSNVIVPQDAFQVTKGLPKCFTNIGESGMKHPHFFCGGNCIPFPRLFLWY